MTGACELSGAIQRSSAQAPPEVRVTTSARPTWMTSLVPQLCLCPPNQHVPQDVCVLIPIVCPFLFCTMPSSRMLPPLPRCHDNDYGSAAMRRDERKSKRKNERAGEKDREAMNDLDMFEHSNTRNSRNSRPLTSLQSTSNLPITTTIDALCRRKKCRQDTGSPVSSPAWTKRGRAGSVTVERIS